MDVTHMMALRYIKSMQVFQDGDGTINFGDWKAWEFECQEEGRQIPPAEFKARPKEERQRRYLEHCRNLFPGSQTENQK